MTRIVSTNITSPLGLTTEENYTAVKRGESGLRVLDGCLGVPGHHCVGIFSDQQKAYIRQKGYSWFESIVLYSVKEALSHSSVDPSSKGTILIVGTSTAGIEELAEVPEKDGSYLAPGVAVKKIADALGFINNPITISNACISGATAQMLAHRFLSTHYYDTAVVCGVDVVSSFVLACFDSFKAMSPTICKPFDIERLGLNIGECAATIILTNSEEFEDIGWRIVDGCLNNDAYHVSAPIPSGDGVCRTIKRIMTPVIRDSLACITAHGTATMFNDQMESKAIEDAGLGDILITAYKPHFGHTFGASSVIESIITMCSIDEGLILPILGFEEIGVSGNIRICQVKERTDKLTFLKIQSGFGGCNGSLVYSKLDIPSPPIAPLKYKTVKRVRITPESLLIDDKLIPTENTGGLLLSEIYKEFLSDGSRFHKMDLFSKLAYIGTGLLAKNFLDKFASEDIALFLFTLNGSVLADRKHLSTFSNPEEYYPSPSVSINTLPNVVLGEIAVRNSIKGETTLVMLPEEDQTIIEGIINATLSTTHPSVMIYGWVDCKAEDSFLADIKMLTIN